MIDIIIPAYNSHDTIINTLFSINMQTIKDKLNIIIVDDYSDKGYEEIVKLFEDLNIKIVRLKDNKGPGYARERGMKESTNKYIYFMDSDDCFINMFSLEYLYNNIKNNDIIAGLVVIEDKNNEVNDVKITKFDLHGKLFKRKYIEENYFSFNNTRRSEDNSFYRLLRLGTNKYKEIESEIELYSYNKDSITNKDNNYRINESNYLLDNIKWLEKEALKRKFNTESLAYTISIYFSYFFILTIENPNDTEINDSFKRFMKILNKYKKHIDFVDLYSKIELIKKDYHTKVMYDLVINELLNK